jgi:hypothetical protein
MKRVASHLGFSIINPSAYPEGVIKIPGFT